MKAHFRFWPLLALLLVPAWAHGQANLNRLRKVEEGLYFMYYDSSAAKSTVVEFRDFVALIEVPVADEGAGARNLRDHRAGGERVLATLAHYFPTKPLRYVLHSHWHPHSLSAVEPFLAKGATLISTRTNFEKIKTFLPPDVVTRYAAQVQFVTGDSLVIRDRRQRLVAYRFEQKDYPNTPTPEYLFFRLPHYNLLTCGCMFTRWEGPPVDGKVLLTGRADDLNRFLDQRHLHPRALIRLSVEKDEPTDLKPIERLTDVVTHGIRAADLAARYERLPLARLQARRDSLAEATIRQQIPASILNGCVYRALTAQQLDRALALAQLQAQVSPADPNAWDTLGEVYFFLNQPEVARHYEQQVRRMAPAFTQGGAAAWAKDLAEYQQKWQVVNTPSRKF